MVYPRFRQRGWGVYRHLLLPFLYIQSLLFTPFSLLLSLLFCLLTYYAYLLTAGALPGSLGQLSLPSTGIGKSSLWAGVRAERVHLCRVAGDLIWHVTSLSSVM